MKNYCFYRMRAFVLVLVRASKMELSISSTVYTFKMHKPKKLLIRKELDMLTLSVCLYMCLYILSGLEECTGTS